MESLHTERRIFELEVAVKRSIAKLAERENDLALSRLSGTALGSELLSLQQDCIAAVKRVAELETGLRDIKVLVERELFSADYLTKSIGQRVDHLLAPLTPSTPDAAPSTAATQEDA